MSIFRSLLVVLVFAFSISGLIAQPGKGEKAPEVLLPDPTGQPVSLHSLKGKVVLIDFWASWCGPCRYSNKRIAPIYEKYKSAGFEIFGISIDTNKNAWKKAIAADNIQWLQVIDSGGWEGTVPQQWGINQIPTSFLLNKDGKVVAIDPSDKELETMVGKLLKQTYPSAAK